MPDYLRRAVRTFIQAFIGSVLTTGILSSIGESGVVDWSTLKKVLVSAVAAGVIATLTLVQNWLEDSPKVAFPAMLKAIPSPGVNPVTVDPPAPPAKKAPAKRAPAKKAAK